MRGFKAYANQFNTAIDWPAKAPTGSATNDNDAKDFYLQIGADASNENLDCSDAFVQKLQTSVEKIKFDREMGKRYMLFEEIRKEEYEAGKIEGELSGRISSIITLLSDLAPVPENLKRKIESIESLEQLEMLVKKAARVDSLEEFEQALDETN